MYGVFDNGRLYAVSGNLTTLTGYLHYHFESIGGINKSAHELINSPYDYDGYGDMVEVKELVDGIELYSFRGE